MCEPSQLWAWGLGASLGAWQELHWLWEAARAQQLRAGTLELDAWSPLKSWGTLSKSLNLCLVFLVCEIEEY